MIFQFPPLSILQNVILRIHIKRGMLRFFVFIFFGPRAAYYVVLAR
jgi:hypothetical protein